MSHLSNDPPVTSVMRASKKRGEHADVLDQRESAFDLVYAADSPTLWRTDFAPKGAVEAWLNADRRTAVGTWITEQVRGP